MGKSLKGRELGEGICQQADGLYCARYTDREGKRRCKRSKNLKEAREWLDKGVYAKKHCDINNVTDMSVDAWFNYWIDIKKKTVRISTVKNYEDRYNINIKNAIGNKLLVDVKPIHCQNIFIQMGEDGYMSSTINQTRATMYNMFELAKENDIIIANPCKKSLKSNLGKPSVKKEALTIEEQKNFLKAIRNHRYENQFKLALQTGLRSGEITGLKWEDVDFRNQTLSVNRNMEYKHNYGWMVGEPKSESGHRTIPLTDEAVKILKSQKAKNAKLDTISYEWNDVIFLNKKGEPIKNGVYDSALRVLCDKAGLRRFGMHVLRHTFATRCIEGGMIPKTLQRILGHSSLDITMNLYVHITEDEKRREIELVADALNAI